MRKRYPLDQASKAMQRAFAGPRRTPQNIAAFLCPFGEPVRHRLRLTRDGAPVDLTGRLLSLEAIVRSADGEERFEQRIECVEALTGSVDLHFETAAPAPRMGSDVLFEVSDVTDPSQPIVVYRGAIMLTFPAIKPAAPNLQTQGKDT